MTLFVADLGKNVIHWYNQSTKKLGKISGKNKKQFLELNFGDIQSGDTLVIEDAHLREQTEDSLAHPFNFEELNILYDWSIEKDIKILKFPQKSTPKARNIAGVSDKNDENDVKAIATFLTMNNNAFKALKKFVPIMTEQYRKENSHVFEYIQTINEDLNIPRSLKYGEHEFTPYTDDVLDWIDRNRMKICEYLNYDEDMMADLGLSFNKAKYIKQPTLTKQKKHSRIYTLVTCFIRPNGELRQRTFPVGHKNEGKYMYPHWKFVKDTYFGLTPFHFKQGIASSNYKYHWRANCVDFKSSGPRSKTIAPFNVPHDKYVKATQARSKYDKKLRKYWRVFYKMIIVDGIR